MHPAALPVERLWRECELRRVRRSGPGGQHRNKVETGVVLCHRPTGVRAEASERRSQAENQAVALRRLRIRLALEVRRPVEPAGPSELWRSRLRGGRMTISPRHDDFPALLAEALDWLWRLAGDVRAAAEALGCTASQLVRLLAYEPAALARVNQWRVQHGLRPLRRA